MLVRIIAILFGIGFIFSGVAGFLPSFTPDGLLFGLFMVDTMHNIVHLVSGVIAIMAATSLKYSLLYFKIFAIIYGIVTVLGFWMQGDLHFMMIHMNMADNFLHLGITLVSLYVGFFMHRKPV